MPLLLCVAELGRQDRSDELDDQLLEDIQRRLNVRFAPESAVLALGRVGVCVALKIARQLMLDQNVPNVMVASVDSLVNAAVLRYYEENDRLLTPSNSDGLMVGEAGGAVLLGRCRERSALRLAGLGLGKESAHIDSGLPLRSTGLAGAVTGALNEAGLQLHELDYRITDISGESYYFKEDALCVGRLLRRHKEQFENWHPAESVGEVGAAAGSIMIALALYACRKGFAPGQKVIMHWSADDGQRAAAVFVFEGDR